MSSEWLSFNWNGRLNGGLSLFWSILHIQRWSSLLKIVRFTTIWSASFSKNKRERAKEKIHQNHAQFDYHMLRKRSLILTFTLMIKKENAHTKRAEISFGQRLKNHKIPAQYSECHVSDRPANSINIIAALQKIKWITTLEQLLCVLGALVIGIVQCVNN